MSSVSHKPGNLGCCREKNVKILLFVTVIVLINATCGCEMIYLGIILSVKNG